MTPIETRHHFFPHTMNTSTTEAVLIIAIVALAFALTLLVAINREPRPPKLQVGDVWASKHPDSGRIWLQRVTKIEGDRVHYESVHLYEPHIEWNKNLIGSDPIGIFTSYGNLVTGPSR